MQKLTFECSLVIVTGSGKTDLMGIFVQIELLVPSECSLHCTSIGAIDAVIDGSVAKL